MKLARYSFITEINKRFLQFISAAFLIIPIIYYVTGTESAVHYTYFLIPVPILCYLINRYCKKLYLYIPLLICLAAIVLVPSLKGPIILPVLFTIFLLSIFIHNFITSLHTTEELKKNSSPALLLFPLVSLIFIYTQSLTILTNQIFILFFLGIIIYLINHYIIHLAKYFNNNSDVSGIPYGQIKTSNHLLIGIFMVLCILIMLLFIFFPLKSILTGLGSLFLMGLRAFFSLFSFEQSDPEIIPTVEDTPTSSTDFFDTQTPEASPIMQIIEGILITVGVIALIVAAAALIIYLLLLFYRYFYGRNQDTRDTAAFLSPFDKRESISRQKQNISTPKRRRFSIFKSKSEKIRYMFYQAIIGKHKEYVPQAMTAYELLYFEEESHSILKTELDKLAPEQAMALTALYNKARYSEEACTSADVNYARSLIRQYLNL